MVGVVTRVDILIESLLRALILLGMMIIRDMISMLISPGRRVSIGQETIHILLANFHEISLMV